MARNNSYSGGRISYTVFLDKFCPFLAKFRRKIVKYWFNSSTQKNDRLMIYTHPTVLFAVYIYRPKNVLLSLLGAPLSVKSDLVNWP